MKDRIHPNLRAMIDNMTEEQKEAISKKLSEPSEVMYEEIQQRLKDAFNPPQPEATISGWVCRDKDGTLCLYYKKPMRGKEEWFGNYDRQLPEDCFPSLTWQDEPIEVEITIKPKKQ
jgi:hypothetical protein